MGVGVPEVLTAVIPKIDTGAHALVLINHQQRDPVVPAFPDLHIAPASMLKELSPFFRRFNLLARLLALPAPHELNPREAMEYPFKFSSISSLVLLLCISCLNLRLKSWRKNSLVSGDCLHNESLNFEQVPEGVLHCQPHA